ncbi:MAG: hypothetical protein ACRDIC_19500 [bacterium]
MRHGLRLVLITLLLVVWTVPVAAHELTVASFNVESGGADPTVVAEQIRAQPAWICGVLRGRGRDVDRDFPARGGGRQPGDSVQGHHRDDGRR